MKRNELFPPDWIRPFFVSVLAVLLFPVVIHATALMGRRSTPECQTLLIHLLDNYGVIQKEPLSQKPTNIRHMTWFKGSGGVQRLDITYSDNKKQEIRLMWNPDSIRGLSFWCESGNECLTVPGLENQKHILGLSDTSKSSPSAPYACSGDGPSS